MVEFIRSSSNRLNVHIRIFMGAARCSSGSGTGERISGLFVYERDFPDSVKSYFL